jgi:hypothetical protein
MTAGTTQTWTGSVSGTTYSNVDKKLLLFSICTGLNATINHSVFSGEAAAITTPTVSVSFTIGSHKYIGSHSGDNITTSVVATV